MLAITTRRLIPSVNAYSDIVTADLQVRKQSGNYQKVDFFRIWLSLGCDGFGKRLESVVLHNNLVNVSGKEHVVFNHGLFMNKEQCEKYRIQ